MKKSLEQIQEEIRQRDIQNRWIEKEGLYTPRIHSSYDGPVGANRDPLECIQFGACAGLVAGFVGMFFELGIVCFLVTTVLAAVGMYALNDK